MKVTIKNILKEDVNTTLYDKVIKVMRRPYIDFLRKNGLGDEKSVKEIMKRKFGDGRIMYLNEDEWNFDVIEYRFTWSNDKKGFYEERKYRDGEVRWEHLENEVVKGYGERIGDIITLRKNINSDGSRGYFELTDDLSDIKHEYYVDDGTWDNAPIEVKNDIFFSNNY